MKKPWEIMDTDDLSEHLRYGKIEWSFSDRWLSGGRAYRQVTATLVMEDGWLERFVSRASIGNPDSEDTQARMEDAMLDKVYQTAVRMTNFIYQYLPHSRARYPEERFHETSGVTKRILKDLAVQHGGLVA